MDTREGGVWRLRLNLLRNPSLKMSTRGKTSVGCSLEGGDPNEPCLWLNAFFLSRLKGGCGTFVTDSADNSAATLVNVLPVPNNLLWALKLSPVTSTMLTVVYNESGNDELQH